MRIQHSFPSPSHEERIKEALAALGKDVEAEVSTPYVFDFDLEAEIIAAIKDRAGTSEAPFHENH